MISCVHHAFGVPECCLGSVDQVAPLGLQPALNPKTLNRPGLGRAQELPLPDLCHLVCARVVRGGDLWKLGFRV